MKKLRLTEGKGLLKIVQPTGNEARIKFKKESEKEKRRWGRWRRKGG
jgi:hypothetical protein